MATKSGSASSPVDAVQAIYAALEPLDEETRRRVVSSALSLLGMAQQPVESPGTARRSHVSPEAVPQSRAKSPVELIQEKNPATNPQRIAVFAYYREKFEGEPRFSRADIHSYFGKAKEPPPGNYDRDWNRCSPGLDPRGWG